MLIVADVGKGTILPSPILNSKYRKKLCIWYMQFIYIQLYIDSDQHTMYHFYHLCDIIIFTNIYIFIFIYNMYHPYLSIYHQLWKINFFIILQSWTNSDHFLFLSFLLYLKLLETRVIRHPLFSSFFKIKRNKSVFMKSEMCFILANQGWQIFITTPPSTAI